MSPDQIVLHIPSITLGDVHSALAYYFDNPEEIQGEARDGRADAEEFRRRLGASMLSGAHPLSH